jgi:hypothetical protein
MAGYREDDETNLTWNYSEGIVKGWTSLQSVADRWQKAFGVDCLKISGARSFSLEVPLERVKKPFQIAKTVVQRSPEQKEELRARLAEIRRSQSSKKVNPAIPRHGEE